MFTKNLKIKKKSKKLDYIKVKQFFIKAKKGIVSYKLKLPKNAKVYFMFHVLLLKLEDLKILIQDMFYYQFLEEIKFEI